MLLQLTKLLTRTQINPFYTYVQKISFNLLVNKLKDIDTRTCSIGRTIELRTKVNVKYKIEKDSEVPSLHKEIIVLTNDTISYARCSNWHAS